MELVDHATFFKQLAALFEATHSTGTVWLTHKRLTYGVESVPSSSADDEREYPCLIRATNGKKTEFETRVEPGQLEAFHAQYGTLLKSSMTSHLRKRDKKREKQRAEELARRKKRLAEPIPIEGPKRGNGRKKRTRRIKAAAKQEDARKKAAARDEKKGKS